MDQVQKEQRYHERHPLVPGDPLTASLLGGINARVIDISYGGILMQASGSRLPSEDQFRAASEMEIHHLGRTRLCCVVSVRNISVFENNAMLAYEFRHQAAESLLFLKNIIEPIRNGGSLVKLSSENLKEPYNSPEWSCYRGDGPIDVIAEFDENRTHLLRVIMTFRHESQYFEVAYDGGKIKTSMTDELPDQQDPGAVCQLVKQTSKIDPEIIAHCASIMMGFNPEIREELGGFVSSVMARLVQKTSTAA